MSRTTISLITLPVLLACGCAKPIALRTYDGDVLVYPDFLPASKPTILAFLDGNDRRCDKLVKPLRGFASRKEVELVAVLTYDDNAYLENISTKREIVFPVMLDPRKKLVKHFGVSKYPTFVYLSPQGKELARAYDFAAINPWYKPEWVYKAHGRTFKPSPEEMADDDVSS